MLMYTSGTTGRPKGIKRPLTEPSILVPNPLLKLLCSTMCGMNETSVYLSPAPLYHAAPLRFNMMCGALGGTSIIMESFDAEEFLRLVEKHKVTQSQLVPTMFVRMLKLPEEVRKSSAAVASDEEFVATHRNAILRVLADERADAHANRACNRAHAGANARASSASRNAGGSAGAQRQLQHQRGWQQWRGVDRGPCSSGRGGGELPPAAATAQMAAGKAELC